MLQQTTVATILQRYAPFVVQFPTVHALAAASCADVCAAWAGMGYYARARNLHAAAQQIVHQYNGQLPSSTQALRTLKGVGAYTAAAVAAIAFGEAVVPIDGNILRIGARLMGCTTPLPQAAPQIEVFMQQHFAAPQVYNIAQALMDIGARVCTPKNPRCGACPLQPQCVAHRTQQTQVLPYKTAKTPRQTQHMMAWLLHNAQQQWYAPIRPAQGLWGGMRGFVLTDSDSLATVPHNAQIVRVGAVFTHILTHKTLHITPVLAHSAQTWPSDDSIFAHDIKKLPTIMQKVATALFSNASDNAT